MKRLLIVDDQPGIRFLLNEVFSKEDFHTYLAANGMEALKKLETEEIDCVLLDMRLPGIDGIDVLRILRKKDEEMPVLILSGLADDDYITEAYELGALKHFTKPFNIMELRDEVKEILLG